MDELHDIHGLIKVAEYDELKSFAVEIEGVVMNRPSGNGTPDTDSGSDEDYISHLKSLKADE